MVHTADYWINSLQLEPHPEGGYFKRITQSKEFQGFSEQRKYSTIYYLLASGQVSRFHRLLEDEIWFYHEGSPICLHLLGRNGYQTLNLGLDVEKGQLPQVLIEKKTWFAAEIIDNCSFSLVSCAVIPEYIPDHFELAKRNDMFMVFSEYKELINQFTDDV